MEENSGKSEFAEDEKGDCERLAPSQKARHLIFGKGAREGSYWWAEKVGNV